MVLVQVWSNRSKSFCYINDDNNANIPDVMMPMCNQKVEFLFTSIRFSDFVFPHN